MKKFEPDFRIDPPFPRPSYGTLEEFQHLITDWVALNTALADWCVAKGLTQPGGS
jgi:hypothetical protein